MARAAFLPACWSCHLSNRLHAPNAPASPPTGPAVRDLLAWAHFITATAPRVGALPAYAHGAHLVLLDGIGLGVGLAAEVRARAAGNPQRALSRVLELLDKVARV